VADSTFSEVGDTGVGGAIRVAPRSGADVIASIRNCSILNALTALFVLAAINSPTDVMMNPSYIGGSGNAVTASGAGAVVRIKGSLIANNTGTALNRVNGGRIVSLGGNSIVGNAVKGSFSSTQPQE
jgi:hypothetical protein